MAVAEEEVEIGGEEDGEQLEDPGQQAVEEYHSEFTLPHQVSCDHLILYVVLCLYQDIIGYYR